MSRYCIDTNIIVYTMNGLEPAAEFMKTAQNEEIIYSVIVEAELFSSWKLTEEDINDLREILDLGEIIEVNSSLALKAAELRRLSKVNFNRSLKLPDALIAATAMEHAAVLATRNEDDFNHLADYGLKLFNPFSASA